MKRLIKLSLCILIFVLAQVFISSAHSYQSPKKLTKYLSNIFEFISTGNYEKFESYCVKWNDIRTFTGKHLPRQEYVELKKKAKKHFDELVKLCENNYLRSYAFEVEIKGKLDKDRNYRYFVVVKSIGFIIRIGEPPSKPGKSAKGKSSQGIKAEMVKFKFPIIEFNGRWKIYIAEM